MAIKNKSPEQAKEWAKDFFGRELDMKDWRYLLVDGEYSELFMKILFPKTVYNKEYYERKGKNESTDI